MSETEMIKAGIFILYKLCSQGKSKTEYDPPFEEKGLDFILNINNSYQNVY